MKNREYNNDWDNVNDIPDDDYQRQYQEQLDRFSRMSGNDYNEEIDVSDLKFYNPDEIRRHNVDRYNPTGYNRNGSRTPTYSQRNPQRPQSRSVNRDLQFGVNNKTKNHDSRYAPDFFDSKSRQSYESNKKRSSKVQAEKEHRKKSPVKRFFKCLIIILLLIAVITEVMLYRYAGMVNTVETGNRQYTNASLYDDDIMNVLVIGSDSRSIEDRGRTDTMLLLSIDNKTDKITMTSFMRDMYVQIPDNGWDKLNAANVYGGVELLMDTIELNFDIRIDKYIYIDFYSFVDIVDAIGGIELDISDEEAQGMIPPMAEQNKIMGKPKGTDYLKQGGKNLTVNGNQALAYSRLRYVGNADFERTERQRIVLSKIKEKALTFNPIKLNNIATAVCSHITTNMTRNEIFMLENKAPLILGYETEELRIPEEGAYSYGWHDGQSTLDVNFDSCKQTLRNKIYA
ncbi:MAG: LCP family protein [Ruminococcus sp.]|nr:LCP family protein [Ruminococcus sp.]